MQALLALITRQPTLRWISRRIVSRFPAVKRVVLELSYASLLWNLGPAKSGNQPFDKNKKTVVLCLHDGGFTGAPILGWNLAQKLSTTYNIVCIVLSGGKLVDELLPYCFQLIVPSAGSIANCSPNAFARRILKPLVTKYNAEVILANSVESEVTVTAGNILGIPSLSLIHEFAEYTHPIRLERMIAGSRRLIFSSEITADSARRLFHSPLDNIRILPQGRCLIPPGSKTGITEALDDELAALISADDFICIGCGHVQIRKGVDLFIAVATQVLERQVKARFVWIGDGYDPERDFALSVWLKDQIDRGGQSSGITMLPSLTAEQLERLYARSDAMFLSSRLDPLPNVAIDALSMATPVVCFDKASGFPEYFRKDSILREFVVPYYDLGAAADRLVELAQNSDLRDTASHRAEEFAREWFDMERYADQIVSELERISPNEKWEANG